MKNNKTKYGNISISFHAIATIAYQAALKSYGVVGMANENIVHGFARLFSKEKQSGVIVNYENDALYLNLFIVIEYGTRIATVTKSVANTVKFNVEKLVGVPVTEVNVHVRGLRVSDTD
jgi:uncharacterized alkaline shock family protein YloU